jgi:hypothetical protein
MTAAALAALQRHNRGAATERKRMARRFRHGRQEQESKLMTGKKIAIAVALLLSATGASLAQAQNNNPNDHSYNPKNNTQYNGGAYGNGDFTRPVGGAQK